MEKRAIGRRSADRENMKMNTLQLPIGTRERRISMPSGHYAATPDPHRRGKSPANNSLNGVAFKHYGSSLSLSNGSDVGDLTSRTLIPPSPATLKKAAIPGKPKFPQVSKSSKPSLPKLDVVTVRSPQLADYLEKPRLVSLGDLNYRRTLPSEHHAKRMNAANTTYRNLRLGNFIETGEANDEDLIPERLRQYYLDTYLNVCDTCESKTHFDPTSPLQRGM